MLIEYLEEYVELAQCLNFTEAARRCSITQSALSKHLVSLEREIGAQLVIRDRHSVELSQAGHVFLQEALVICERYRLVRQRVNQMSSVPALRVGGLIQNPRILWIMSTALADETGGPDMACSFNQTFSKPFIDLLRGKEVDLIFTYQDEEQERQAGNEFIRKHLFDDPFVAVMEQDHPLSGHECLAMPDLKEETFIHMAGPYYSWGWEHIEKICGHYGFNPKRKPVFIQPGLDYSLVDLQGGVLLLSQSSLTGQLFVRMDAYRCIPVAGDDTHFSICAVARAHDSNKALHILLNRLESLAP